MWYNDNWKSVYKKVKSGGKDMFCVGDVVLYTTYGICRITDQIKRFFNGTYSDYYVLVPLTEAKTQLTIPVTNPNTTERLHKLLEGDEIRDITNQIPYLEAYWIDNDNERKREFSSIIRSGNRLNTLRMIKSIRFHQLSLKDKNRKLHAADEQQMKEATKLIVDEFSYVLNIDKDFVSNRISDEMNKEI